MRREVAIRAYVIGICAWMLGMLLSLKYGTVSGADFELIAQLRLPRVLLASAVGIGLAVSGSALQAVFSNPLCEPYTLGISSGAALGAIIGASLGLHWSLAGLTGTAFIGALAFTAILYLISRRSQSSLTLLLGGVMLGFFGSSLVALWMALSDANGVQGALVWLLGDLSRARLSGSIYTLAGSLLFSGLIWRFKRELDALLLGDEGAMTVGVEVGRVRTRVVLVTAFLISLCVSASGMIGFVGLVVPHFARRWVGSLHGRLIPLAAIWGAVALTLADLLARVLVRPYELPVGVVTALLGAPVFMWVILKTRREGV